MLEAIRKQTGGIVVKSLLGLLILSFAVWGIGDIGMGGASSNVAATVGDQEISSYRLQSEVQRRIREFRQLTGQNFTEEQARSMGIVRATLDELVDSTLIFQGASRLGLTVSDQQVADAIRKSNQFKGALGNFDRQQFMQSLSSLGISEDEYVQLLREDIARNQLISSLVSGVFAPKRLTDDLYRHRQEKRTVEIIRILNSAATNLPMPDEAALLKLHKEKAARFTAPEYRALTVINMTAVDLAKEVSVSSEEINASFEQRSHEFTIAEERDVSQIVFSDKETAKKAHRMLREGRSFEKVAKQVTGQDKSTLRLGLITKEEMIPELADTAFAIKKGTHSAPVKSPLGWHIVQVKDIKPGHSKTLTELRDRLKADIAKDKAIDGLYSLSNKVEDELGGGATLQEAADRLGLKLVKVALVDRTGADASGKAIPGLPKGEFLNIAFSTQSGEDSQMTEVGADGYFVLRVDSVTPAVLKSLETVRKDVITAWKEIQRANATRKAAEQMANDIKGTGSSMLALAKHNGFEYKEVKDILRNQERMATDIPSILTKKAFDMVPGETTFGRDGNSYIVVRLKKVTPAVLGDDKDAHNGLSDALATGMRRDLLRQLSSGLRKSLGVTINNIALNNSPNGG